jgi:hypothetical protein
MGENSGTCGSSPLVLAFWTGAPPRIKMLQQKLVHAIVRGVGFQQHFANVNFALRATSRKLPQFVDRNYFLAACASIVSITNALDPPRSYSFPLATTLSPANGRSFAFCPLDGMVSAIGQ